MKKQDIKRTTADTGFKFYPQVTVDGRRFQPAIGVTTAAYAGTKVKVRVNRGEDRRKQPESCWVSYTDEEGRGHSEVWTRV